MAGARERTLNLPPAYFVVALVADRFIAGEKAILGRTFGRRYLDYKARVRRWLQAAARLQRALRNAAYAGSHLN